MRRPVLHPFLFALFPILSLAAHNIGEVSLRDLWRPILVAEAGTALVFLLLRRLLRNPDLAGLATSLGLVLFASYGHVYRWGAERFGLQHRYLEPIAAAAFVAGLALLRRFRHAAPRATALVNVAAAGLVAISGGRIAWDRLGAPRVVRTERTRAADPSLALAAASRPDIYYMILDGYGSEATLRDVYGYDDGPFLRDLEARGFYVARESHSNYSMTPLSLASSLNFEYVNWLSREIGEDVKDMRFPQELIRDSRTMRELRRLGYRFVHFESGWPVTGHNPLATWSVACGGLTEFEEVLLGSTLARPFQGFFLRSDERARKRILCAFDTLAAIPRRIAAPRFVFVHVVFPHPPFVFGANGEPVRFGERRPSGEGWWHLKSAYVNQLTFCNRKVLAAIDRIRAGAASLPVIILQGDHGPASEGYETATDSLMRERFGILNALCLPADARAKLYPSMSPVNNFRAVLDGLFAADLPMLPDRSYFSQYSTPYRFVDVTGKVARGSAKGDRSAGGS